MPRTTTLDSSDKSMRLQTPAGESTPKQAGAKKKLASMSTGTDSLVGWVKKAGALGAAALLAGPRTAAALQPADAPSPALLPEGRLDVAPPASYDLGWVQDARVVNGQPFQLWGEVYRPQTLTGNHPLAFFMHGQHGVCLDDFSGCDEYLAGACEPLPNHLGYGYIGEELASHGMVAVSINMNAINCFSDVDQNQARGRLLLETIGHFTKWNSSDTAPASLGLPSGGFVNQFNSDIGVMGHSRGGEGARAGLALWREGQSAWNETLAPFKLPAVIELAPVDGQTSNLIDVQGTRWGAILPLCDGDVSDLEGARPYDRAIAAAHDEDTFSKHVFVVHGADHNKANTEWAPYPDDTYGCAGPTNPTLSGTQERNIMGDAIATFFLGTLGRDPAAMQLFNPVYPLPQNLSEIAHIDRSYSVGPSRLTTEHLSTPYENFGNMGLGTGDLSRFVSLVTNHATPHVGVQASMLQWQPRNASQGVEIPLTQDNTSRNLNDFATIDLRAARMPAQSAADIAYEPLEASLQLIDAAGFVSCNVSLTDWASIYHPAGEMTYPSGINPSMRVVLQSVRIPTTAFEDVDLSQASALRITVEQGSAGAVALADVTLSKTLA